MSETKPDLLTRFLLAADDSVDVLWYSDMDDAGWTPRISWQHKDGVTIPPEQAETWRKLGKTPPPW